MGKRLRQEGEGGPHFPYVPPCLTTRGANTKWGGEAQKPPPVEEAAQSYTHTTHTNKPAPRQAGRITEKQSTMGSRAGKLQSPHRQAAGPSCPLPALSPKSPERPPLCLAILPWPLASSLLPGTKRKRVTGQGGTQPSCWVVCPPPSVVRAQGRLLAGHSLVEVDVAQVLGRLLRGTHFLVIVDHPSGEGGGGKG